MHGWYTVLTIWGVVILLAGVAIGHWLL